MLVTHSEGVVTIDENELVNSLHIMAHIGDENACEALNSLYEHYPLDLLSSCANLLVNPSHNTQTLIFAALTSGKILSFSALESLRDLREHWLAARDVLARVQSAVLSALSSSDPDLSPIVTGLGANLFALEPDPWGSTLMELTESAVNPPLTPPGTLL
jgi:hypothetical protein